MYVQSWRVYPACMHPFPAMQVCGRIPENSFLQGTSDCYRMLIVGLQELDLPTGKGNLQRATFYSTLSLLLKLIAVVQVVTMSASWTHSED